jgi:hypothetical protein
MELRALPESYSMSEDDRQPPLRPLDSNTADRAPSEVPSVDLALLRSLVGNELADDEARRLYRLIYTHIEWHDAYHQVLLEQPPPTNHQP